LVYTLGGKKIGEVPILTAGAVREAKFGDYLKRLLHVFSL
ncbi:MAG: Serine-type D-Ala-D-Ala carboxypeptidase, partial [Lacrimispora sp.]|nr:Serine-type D-Ala-D-Ala carboxypeptidase [Lacrimispora sp.]